MKFPTNNPLKNERSETIKIALTESKQKMIWCTLTNTSAIVQKKMFLQVLANLALEI
jgi:hypothetical protein